MVKILMGPLVEQCPANLEYSVVHILSLGNGSFIVGRIEETHVSENYLTDVKPDANKIKPFISAPEPDSKYLALGQIIAESHSIGKELQARE